MTESNFYNLIITTKTADLAVFVISILVLYFDFYAFALIQLR